MPSLISRFANAYDPKSLSNRMRQKRLERFEAMVANLAKPVSILDVGGTTRFWELRGWAERADIAITLVNLTAEPQRHENIRSAAGDATHLSEFGDASFDFVFSNSVIEHLGTIERQKAMADEVRRVGRGYWVQTPNYWFPVEPHFHFPGWQWLPVGVRAAILQRRACGWNGRCPNPIDALRVVSDVRLMTRAEVAVLFPDGQVMREGFFGLVKSWVAWRSAQ
jgi:hypothetical protein